MTLISIFIADCRKINFSDRVVTQKHRRYFGSASERDAYMKFSEDLWDELQTDELVVPIPEFDD